MLKRFWWVIRALGSAPTVSIGLCFSWAVVIEKGGPIASREGVFGVLTPTWWGAITLSVAVMGFYSIINHKPRRWQCANHFMCAVYVVLATAYWLNGVTTAQYTYACLAFTCFLHATNLWVPVGVIKK